MEKATELLTARELATRLRVSPETIHEWARRGTIPTLRLSSKTIRFSLAEVMAALASARAGGVADAQ